jgi:hypothetical protein
VTPPKPDTTDPDDADGVYDPATSPVAGLKARTDPSEKVPTRADPSGAQNKPFPSTVAAADALHSSSGGLRYSKSWPRTTADKSTSCRSAALVGFKVSIMMFA